MQAPALFVHVADESHVSEPEQVVAEEVKGTAEVGSSEREAQHRVSYVHGPFGSVNGVQCVPQSEQLSSCAHVALQTLEFGHKRLSVGVVSEQISAESTCILGRPKNAVSPLTLISYFNQKIHCGVSESRVHSVLEERA